MGRGLKHIERLKVIELVRSGLSISQACKVIASVTPGSVSQWRLKDPNFATLLAEAEQQGKTSEYKRRHITLAEFHRMTDMVNNLDSPNTVSTITDQEHVAA